MRNFLVVTLSLCAPLSAQDSAAASRIDTPRLLWKHAPGQADYAAIQVYGDVVYAMDRVGKLQAIRAASGEPLWSAPGAEGPSWKAGVGLAVEPRSGKLLVSHDRGVSALDLRSGKHLWTAELPMGAAAPVCTADLVIVGGPDGNVYGIGMEKGELCWRHDYLGDAPENPKGGRAGARVAFGRPARPRGAACEAGLVVLSIFDQCRVLALDAKTGRRRWSFQTKGWIYATPEIGPRAVFVASQDRHLYAVDKRSGKQMWKVKARFRNEAQALATPRHLFFGSCDSRIYAVDEGRVSWKTSLRREKQKGVPIYSRPLLIGKTLYAATLFGEVVALHRDTGKLLWRETPLASTDIVTDLVSDGKRLFFATRRRGQQGEAAVAALRVDAR